MAAFSLLKMPMHRTAPIGQFVSFLIFLSLFTLYPLLIKSVWPLFIEQFTTQYSRHLAVILISNVIFFGSYNFVMYFVYLAKHPFFEQFRCNNRPWPWEVDAQQWRKTLKKSLFLVILNMFVLNALMPLLEIALGGIKYKYSMEEFPDGLTIFLQFLFAMLIEDLTFYWSHKTLHHPSFYWIHKVHHEYNTTVSIAATSTHPLEYFFGNAIPTGLGLSLLANFMPVHFVTIFVWFSYRLIQTCEGHCGYEWSWSSTSFVPCKLDSDYHNFHHAYNVGNFGSMFSFWDNLMGTNQEYQKYSKKLNSGSKRQ